MTYLRGRLDAEGGAALYAALDALMRPPTADDYRHAGQRRADALVDLARGALANGPLPTVGGHRPQVGLLISPEALTGLSSGSAGSDEIVAARIRWPAPGSRPRPTSRG
jgi:hypothetical protein